MTYPTRRFHYMALDLASRKDKFLQQIIWGSDIYDEQLILDEAYSLGIDLSKPKVPLLIDATEYTKLPGTSHEAPIKSTTTANERSQFILACLGRYFPAQDGVIATYLGSGAILLLKPYFSTGDLHQEKQATIAATTADIQHHDMHDALHQLGTDLVAHLAKDNVPVRIGVGVYSQGLDGLARSYRSARFALRFGRDLRKESRVHVFNDLLVPAFIESHDNFAKAELADHIIGPLANDPALLHTLRSLLRRRMLFFYNCCPPGCP